jgi:acetoin utilization deacetylase AcuC-like enzyme
VFAPEFVIVSAGFDAHMDDPLANICLSTEFFAWMSTRVMEIADKHCKGRIISMLEGGYNIDKLPLCVEEHLRVLSRQRER